MTRIKRYHDNAMIAHLWANKSQDWAMSHGRTLGFDNRLLKSYGDVIGYHADNVEAIFIEDSSRFSISTCRHIGLACSAARHLTVIRVYDLNSLIDCPSYNRKDCVIKFLVDTHEKNGLYVRELISCEFKLTKRERKKVLSGIRRAKKKAERDAFRAKKNLVSKALRIKKNGLENVIKREIGTRKNYYPNYPSFRDEREKVVVRDLSLHLHRALRFINESELYGARTKKAVQFLRRELNEIKARINHKDNIRSTRETAKILVEMIRDIDKERHKETYEYALRSRMQRIAETDPDEVNSESLEVEFDELGVLAKEAALVSLSKTRFCTAPFHDGAADWIGANISAVADIKIRRQRRGEDVRKTREEENRKYWARKAEEDKVAIAEWLAGESHYIPIDARDERGGFLVRVVGREVQTSGRAIVPLNDAIEAYKKVAFCREKGIEWKRKDEKIFVGSFQIDRIYENGDFKAGCHNFTWETIHALAERIGVA